MSIFLVHFFSLSSSAYFSAALPSAFGGAVFAGRAGALAAGGTLARQQASPRRQHRLPRRDQRLVAGGRAAAGPSATAANDAVHKQEVVESQDSRVEDPSPSPDAAPRLALPPLRWRPFFFDANAIINFGQEFKNNLMSSSWYN